MDIETFRLIIVTGSFNSELSGNEINPNIESQSKMLSAANWKFSACLPDLEQLKKKIKKNHDDRKNIIHLLHHRKKKNTKNNPSRL